MVLTALAAVVLAAAPAFAAASAAPLSFETSLAQIHSAVGALRAEQVKVKSGQIAGQIENLAWDLERAERETSRLKQDLSWLRLRAARYRRENGRPDSDPALRWDLQRFTRELQDLSRGAQWRLDDLRRLSAQAQKDDSLVSPAQRLVDATRRFKEMARWLALDARFAQFDFLRAGFTFEAFEVDRGSRDAETRAQELLGESESLLTKVRGS